jgi:acetyl esterase
VGGDSAGGNLAAVVALEAGGEGLQAPVLQLLIYPVMDRAGCRPSEEHFAEGFFLTRADVHWFHQHYSARQDSNDPRLWPVRAQNLSGLAPALVVTAGFDPLRDEGEAYAAALENAGTPVTLRRHAGLIHGFINLGGVSRSCRTAVIELAQTMNELLGKPVERARPDSALR